MKKLIQIILICFLISQGNLFCWAEKEERLETREEQSGQEKFKKRLEKNIKKELAAEKRQQKLARKRQEKLEKQRIKKLRQREAAIARAMAKEEQKMRK